MPALPKKVVDRFLSKVGPFQKVLQGAKDRDINEADTVTIVKDMLSSIFGFDKYAEITSEYSVRGTFCDLAVKLGGSVKYLVEVKAIGLTLKDNHLRQVVNYGANLGVQWVVLTNALSWEVYRLKFEQPVSYELVFSLPFAYVNPRKQEDQERLFMLCKEGVTKDVIEEFHDHLQSVNRFVISAIILSDPCADMIRRELKKLAPGTKVTNEEITGILLSEVVKREVLEGDAAAKAKTRLKKVTRTIQKQKEEKESAEKEVAGITSIEDKDSDV